MTDVVAEVLVGVRRDPPIGWLVTLGYGGVTTEVWSDVTHLLAPVTHDDVRRALARLRSYPLLTGFRGRPLADIDALADLVVALTDAVVGSNVVEIELNPVLVGAHGAVAVDALGWMEEAGGRVGGRPNERIPCRAARLDGRRHDRSSEGQRHRRGHEQGNGRRLRRPRHATQACGRSSSPVPGRSSSQPVGT